MVISIGTSSSLLLDERMSAMVEMRAMGEQELHAAMISTKERVMLQPSDTARPSLKMRGKEETR